MNKRIALLSLTGVLALASCGQTNVGTTPTPDTPTTSPAVKTGGVSFTNLNGHTVVVKDANGNVVPAANYATLAPGTYTATFSKDGFVSQTTDPFTVNAGAVTPVPVPTLVAVMPPQAYYVNGAGTVVAITAEDLKNAGSRFVFYTWLEDEAGGINVKNIVTGANGLPTGADLGAPTGAESNEVAPVNRQNLAAAYVGYKAADGKVYPVVGANVRWDILEQTGSVRFSAADDGGQPSGAPMNKQDINDNGLSANTYTNRAGNNNIRFPSSAAYPLYNVTGVDTPDYNGFTWTALNHDIKYSTASARVRAIAYVNGTEVTKGFLDKTFAPSAKLEITKTIDNGQAGLNQTRNFTITVRNTGEGAATNVRLNDVLRSGNGNTYSVGPATANGPATTTANATDGFDATFDLAPGQSRTFTLPAQASATGVYCDMATVASYTNGAFGTVTPNLSAEACLTVTAPNLNIVKTLGTYVNGVFTPIASGVEVGVNTPVYARITVNNNGTAPATNVVVTDNIANNTVAANYAIQGAVTAAPQNVTTTANGNDGFTTAPFNLATGATQSFIFAAAATADGTYCDQATFTAVSNNGQNVTGQSEIPCFKVVSPVLTISKVNQNAANLYPGSSYQSVITVKNSGTGSATGLAVQDILGRLGTTNTYVSYGSGSYAVTPNGTTGSVAANGNAVTTVPATLTLAPGQTLTLTLTSTVPAGAPAGEYCDVASYTSTNAGTGSATACVTVRNFVSTQTQMTDTSDPVVAGGSTELFSSLIVEPQSNSAVNNNRVSFYLGTTAALSQTKGIFNILKTTVYYDPTPVRDTTTGQIISDYTSASTRTLVQGTDYTISGETVGGQSINFINDGATNNLTITPGGVIYVRHSIQAPANAQPRQYFNTFSWTGTAVNTNDMVGGASGEPTTVIVR